MNTSSIALSGLNQARTRIGSVARRDSTGPEDTVDFSSGAVTLIQAKNDFAANIRSLTDARDLNKLALKWQGQGGTGCC